MLTRKRVSFVYGAVSWKQALSGNGKTIRRIACRAPESEKQNLAGCRERRSISGALSCPGYGANIRRSTSVRVLIASRRNSVRFEPVGLSLERAPFSGTRSARRRRRDAGELVGSNDSRVSPVFGGKVAPGRAVGLRRAFYLAKELRAGGGFDLRARADKLSAPASLLFIYARGIRERTALDGAMSPSRRRPGRRRLTRSFRALFHRRVLSLSLSLWAPGLSDFSMRITRRAPRPDAPRRQLRSASFILLCAGRYYCCLSLRTLRPD